MECKITPRLNISTSVTEGFYSVTSSALPPHISSLLALLVLTERRKSSNKMPNHRYLIAGTLTFSSSYLMVVFICQTNVRNTIPQAQSLWHHSQLFLPPPLPSPWTVNDGAPSETSAIPQLSVKPWHSRELTARLNPKCESIIGKWLGRATEASLEFQVELI